MTALNVPSVPEPLPDEDGASLLDELRAVLVKYVVFPSPASADAVTLWVAATHAQKAWNCATRLVIKAPEKRCGKSRLLDIIEGTCHNPLMTVNISAAALVRSIGINPPTLLLDEADTVFGKKTGDNHEDLRGIVNAGHQRNRPYIRWDATTRMAENCPTFAMTAVAGIGDMPETIEDRAVIVSMRRRAPHETVEPYRTRRDAPALREIAHRLATWMATIVDQLVDAVPAMPIDDRAADNWEPLIAVADAAGGPWPVLARSAAVAMVNASAEEDTQAGLNTKLLDDIRRTFTTTGSEFIASRQLVEMLHRVEESPWADFNLNTNGLARRLSGFGVKPKPDTTGKVRGYHQASFTDAFSRYLPVKLSEPSEPVRAEDSRASAADGWASSDTPNRQTQPRPSDAVSDKHRGLTVSDGSDTPYADLGTIGA
jgi:hypothetical protein